MTSFDRVSLLATVALAALLRLPGLDRRGRFDADQGHDMLTLVAFTRDGVIPLLGPKTSVGEFHHGALYYFLLAPASAVSNGDPVAVTAFIALLGIAAVALTWWLGRAIGGPIAGLVAGVLLAASPAAIEESTFIWNPNPIGFFAVLSLAAAWRARSGGGAAWWALAIGAAGAVVQLHVLGLVFLLAVVALGLVELRRDRTIWRGVLGGLAIVAVLFVPLVAYELQTGFAETRAVMAYLSEGDEATADSLSSLVFTLLRVIGWPIVGLVTDAPALAALAAAVTLALALVGLRFLDRDAVVAMRWLLSILIWTVVALAFAAPSLQRVVAGLPSDHYHAFADPVVVLLIGVPAGVLVQRAAEAWRTTRRPASLAGVTIASLGLLAVVAVETVRQPPWVDPNQGWAGARLAGERVVEVTGGDTVWLTGLPDFKLTDGIGFPIDDAGGNVGFLVDLNGYPEIGMATVVVCDRLFEGPIGRPCGGPAEDELVARLAGLGSGPGAAPPALIDRFDASPRTSISIYGPGTGP